MSIKNLTKIPAFLVSRRSALPAPRAAQAQGGVSLAPWAGVYIPTRHSVGDLDNALSRDVSGMAPPVSPSGVPASWASRPPAAMPQPGSRARLSMRPNTNLFVASPRLLLALSPVTNRVGFYMAAGPALLTRGKNTFDDEGAAPTSAPTPAPACASA